MDYDDRISSWLEGAATLIRDIDVRSMASAAEDLIRVRNANGTMFVAGNGGSASTANHLALDLQKAGISPAGVRPKVISLSENIGLITAWSNDESFDVVFEKQLEALAEEGDSLLVISVSGSSPNLVRAVSKARDIGMTTVGFLGKDGGVCRDLLDHPIILPSWDYGWVESGHVVLHHILTNIFHESEH
ncbi:MAG: SIS domain-containing protein [Longimicrobiales bacterium]|nr:SIS domain-containing protein [Longimicrobiales bacterium]